MSRHAAWTILAAWMMIGGMACSAGRPVEVQRTGDDGHDHHTGGPGMLQMYEPQPSDAAWVRRLGEFHGHLGPWVIIGHMIGADARQRLRTRGYWDIEVVCWMPLERQKQPWSCILDGLQVATGATLGKQNIRFADSAEVLREGWPVVDIMTRPTPDHPATGLSYRPSESLSALMAGMSPDRLESLSREIASRRPAELFLVREMPLERTCIR